MWTLSAIVRPGDNRPVIEARDEAGALRLTGYFIADMLLWLLDHGQRDIAYYAGDRQSVFRLATTGLTPLDTSKPPAGHTELIEGTGKGPRLTGDRSGKPVSARPTHWEASEEGKARLVMSRRWLKAAMPRPSGRLPGARR